MVEEKILYIPTEEEKVQSEKICDRFIESLNGLSLAQRTFIMAALIHTFQEVYGVNLSKSTTTFEDENE